MTKLFSDYEQQLMILKEKKLVIEDESYALLCLKEYGYYNLINGYSELFKIHDKHGNKEYMQSVTLRNIKALYDFDTELKNIIYKYAIKIENKVKSSLSYVFSKKYSPNDMYYLRKECFSVAEKKSNKINQLINKIKELKESALNQKSKYYKNFIHHTQKKHGYVPFWCLIRILSFGTISKFYKLMKGEDQRSVANELNIKYEYLASFLELIVQFRNIVAHGERTFSYLSNSITLSRKLDIYDTIGVPRNKKMDVLYGSRDIFALLIAFKYFLSKNELKYMFIEIKWALAKLKEEESEEIYHKVLKKMGLNNEVWEKLDEV